MLPVLTGFSRSRVRHGWSCLLGLLYVTLSGSPLLAQAGGPPVNHEHWSYELLDALDIAGVSSAWMVYIRPTGREVVRGELQRTRTVEGAPNVSWSSWVDLFDAESPVRFDASGSRAEVGATAGTRSGTAFLEPGGGPYLALDGSLALSSSVGLWGKIDSGSGERFDGLIEGGISLPFPGPLQVIVGRQWLRAGGPGELDSVLGGSIPLDAVHLVSTRATPLPGLGWLFGPVAWQFALAPWGGVGDLDQGWIGLGSAVAQPHPRFRIGFSRVARFGGAQTESITAERLLKMFFVLQNDPTSWDDQLFEVSFRFRWEAFGLPLASYAVLSQDDSPLWKQPGLQLGTAASLVRESGVFLIRYEYNAIGPRARWCPGCPRNRGNRNDWYQHGTHGLYERNQIPAGSSVGGFGAEHSLSFSAFPAAGKVRYKAWSFFQIRNDEGNLLLERWPGKRAGLGGEVSWIPVPGLEVTASGLFADGPEIEAESSIWLRARFIFPSLARN